ncbi:hypothetical protein R3P38DRAFT_2940660 [Favolaschia claudopus]|uniref:Uncharacterized protein n=1 Tax=Favolaschia claudopus TaxID=2862362 RepID=A0AAW0BP63_9AGAR
MRKAAVMGVEEGVVLFEFVGLVEDAEAEARGGGNETRFADAGPLVDDAAVEVVGVEVEAEVAVVGVTTEADGVGVSGEAALGPGDDVVVAALAEDGDVDEVLAVDPTPPLVPLTTLPLFPPPLLDVLACPVPPSFPCPFPFPLLALRACPLPPPPPCVLLLPPPAPPPVNLFPTGAGFIANSCTPGIGGGRKELEGLGKGEELGGPSMVSERWGCPEDEVEEEVDLDEVEVVGEEGSVAGKEGSKEAAC